jgi:hypothetical protein
MPTLDDVYQKFGETAEAAQLLETELGNILMVARCIDEGLLEKKNPTRAADILDSVNRHTLGQLLTNLNNRTQSLEALLVKARDERNRLSHSFYREHNFRRNSDEGRTLMLADLETVHSALLDAYKAALALSGADLDEMAETPLPTPPSNLNWQRSWPRDKPDYHVAQRSLRSVHHLENPGRSACRCKVRSCGSGFCLWAEVAYPVRRQLSTRSRPCNVCRPPPKLR